jgi:serine/threonine-protein kinase
MSDSPVTIQLDNVTFQLQEWHDFEWLRGMGRVFSVFDQQDSGNISFGFEKDGVSRFVKYAGAKPLHYAGSEKEAVERLKQSVSVNADLANRHLVRMLDHFGTAAGGHAAVFEWFEGECLHPHWSFPPPAKYVDPRSPYFRFRQLPAPRRLHALRTIFLFHLHVEAQGYAAVDFYDGSILYDFAANETKICDVDLYSKQPFVNTMGRMWGSTRFMAPEEFEHGAVIDERTNVFRMGAVAFALAGGELDRSFDKWDAGPERYEVALRAVEPSKADRFSSVAEFYEAWESASDKQYIEYSHQEKGE